MLTINRKSAALIMLVISLSSIIFFPPYVFSVQGAEAGQKIVFGFCLLVFFSFFIFYKKGTFYGLTGIALIFFPMTLCMALSSIVNGATLGKALNAFRYPAYFFVLCYFVTLLSNLSLKRMVKVLVSIYWAQIAFCVIQFFIPESQFVKYFSYRGVFDYLGPRIGGTFEWSYSLAMFLTPFFVYFFLMWANTSKLKYLVSLVICCVVIVAGQSKTAIVSSFFALCLLFVLCAGWRQKIFRKLLLAAIVISGLVIGLIAKVSKGVELEHLNSAISMLYSRGTLDPSAAYRLEQLNIAFNGFLANLVFGDPRAYEITIENAYMDYAFRYGLPCLALYLVLMIYVMYKAYSLIQNVVKHKEALGYKVASLLIGVCMTFLVFPIYAVSYSPSDAHRLSFWFYFLLALTIISFKKLKSQTT